MSELSVLFIGLLAGILAGILGGFIGSCLYQKHQRKLDRERWDQISTMSSALQLSSNNKDSCNVDDPTNMYGMGNIYKKGNINQNIDPVEVEAKFLREIDDNILNTKKDL